MTMLRGPGVVHERIGSVFLYGSIADEWEQAVSDIDLVIGASGPVDDEAHVSVHPHQHERLSFALSSLWKLRPARTGSSAGRTPSSGLLLLVDGESREAVRERVSYEKSHCRKAPSKSSARSMHIDQPL